jgi:hypothetical protein
VWCFLLWTVLISPHAIYMKKNLLSLKKSVYIMEKSVYILNNDDNNNYDFKSVVLVLV